MTMRQPSGVVPGIAPWIAPVILVSITLAIRGPATDFLPQLRRSERRCRKPNPGLISGKNVWTRQGKSV
jgi:hypothetical protein